MGKTYGYIRVSSIDQNESRQRLAMQERAIATAAARLRITEMFISIRFSPKLRKIS